MTRPAFLLTLVAVLVGATLALLAIHPRGMLQATDAMPCADLDGDGVVTQTDVDIEQSYFGQRVPPAPPQADMNGDTVISVADIAYVAGQVPIVTGCQDKPVGPKGPCTPVQQDVFFQIPGKLWDWWKCGPAFSFLFDRIDIAVEKTTQDMKLSAAHFVCRPTGEKVVGIFKRTEKDVNGPGLHHEVWSGEFVQKCDGVVDVYLQASPANPNRHPPLKHAAFSNPPPPPTTPTPTPKSSTVCGPGPHWVDPCPAGSDYLPQTTALVGIDTNQNCLTDLNYVFSGPVRVQRQASSDDSARYPGLRPMDGHMDVIDTEIVSMSLTGSGLTLRVGKLAPGINPNVSNSYGAIAEQPPNPNLADSFFDVFFEVTGGAMPLYNHGALNVQATIDKVPPKARDYLHPSPLCLQLFDRPVGGTYTGLNLTSAKHNIPPPPPPDDCDKTGQDVTFQGKLWDQWNCRPGDPTLLFSRIDIDIGKNTQAFKLNPASPPLFLCRSTGEKVAGEFKRHEKDANLDILLPHHEVWSADFATKCQQKVDVYLQPNPQIVPLNHPIIKEVSFSNPGCGKVGQDVFFQSKFWDFWKCAPGDPFFQFDRIDIDVGKATQEFKLNPASPPHFVCQATGEKVSGSFKAHEKHVNLDPILPHHEVWSGDFTQKCKGGVDVYLQALEPTNHPVIKEVTFSNVPKKEADVEIEEFLFGTIGPCPQGGPAGVPVPGPTCPKINVPIGTAVTYPVWETKHNAGPQERVGADVSWIAYDKQFSPPLVNARWVPQAGDVCTWRDPFFGDFMVVDCATGGPDGQINDLHFKVALPRSITIPVRRDLQIFCKAEGSTSILVQNFEAPQGANDPDPSDNFRELWIPINCVRPEPPDTDIAIRSFRIHWDIHVEPGIKARFPVVEEKINLGNKGKVDVEVWWIAQPSSPNINVAWIAQPGDTCTENGVVRSCVITDNRTEQINDLHFQMRLQQGLPALVRRDIEIHCKVPGLYSISLINIERPLTSKGPPPVEQFDPNPGNNVAVAAATIWCGGPGIAPDKDGDFIPDATEIALGTDPNNPDTDGDKLNDSEDHDPMDPDTDRDGCKDGHERQSKAMALQCGGRDELNGYDYFNPTKDCLNRVDDILAVVGQYFIDYPDPRYTGQMDRGFLGPNEWNLGPGDGKQRVEDIIANVKQYFHSCPVKP